AAVPPARIAVVEPPCPPLARAHGSSGRETTIVSQSELASESDRVVLLTALAGLLDLDWRLSVIGDRGTNTDCSTELARRLGGRVTVTDQSDRARCEALWLGADIFASADAGPGYGMAIAAALKRGLPAAICRDKAGTPEVPPEAGAAAPPGDHVQLAKALRRLLFDRDLRREMAEAAFRCGQSLPESGAVAQQLASALG
ncbi:MAG: glycosyltransferase, partial [Acetobacteraceae bacterium]